MRDICSDQRMYQNTNPTANQTRQRAGNQEPISISVFSPDSPRRVSQQKKSNKIHRRRKQRMLFQGGALLAGLLFFGVFASKRPRVTAHDRQYIARFMQSWGMTATPDQVHASFQSEMAFLSLLQKNVFEAITHGKISPDKFGNVAEYFTNRTGECYDRTVLLEKIIDVYGFDFRHVYIYYAPSRGHGETKVVDFFRKSTLSHALTEVHTAHGWMAIESNTDCVGLDRSGNLLTVKDIEKELKRTGAVDLAQPCSQGLPFWKKYPNFNYIYGVYSRHGQFLRPHLPLPGYNIRMLAYNFSDN
jgi:hypothetical protein